MMKNAVEKYQPINPALTKVENEYLIATKETQVSELCESECIAKLLQIINISYAELGLSPAGSTIAEKAKYLEAIARLLRNDILSYFQGITIPEVAGAIKRGVRNEYGKYFGFNVISIHGFIENYLNCEDRVSALKKQKKIELNQVLPIELPEEEKWKLYKIGLMNCYEIYRKQKVIRDFGNENYNFLVYAGLINLSNDEKLVIYEVAKQQILKEQELQAVTYRIACQIRKQNQIDDSPIKSRAKEIALKNYFATNPDFSTMTEILYAGFKKAMAAEEARLKIKREVK